MTWNTSNTFGTLSSAPDGSIIETIFDYVTYVLNTFEGDVNENEDNLTYQFYLQLEENMPAEFSFLFFVHQPKEKSGNNYSTDLGVYAKSSSGASPLIRIEAKRLSSKLPNIKKRKREYVIGEYLNGERTNNSGGIERFKNETHGEDVNIAGIIGYVQTDTFDLWEDNINSWIQAEINSPHDQRLTWEESDKLQMPAKGDKVATYQSESSRITKSNLKFRHLWVNLQ